MTRFKLSITLCCLLAAPAAQADERLALNNLSHDFSVCTAYFMVVAQVLRHSNEPDAAKKTDDVANRAAEWALTSSRKAGMKDAATTARVQLAMQEMMKEIDNNAANISILSVKHNEACVALMQDPAKRLQYWLDKKGP